MNEYDFDAEAAEKGLIMVNTPAVLTIIIRENPRLIRVIPRQVASFVFRNSASGLPMLEVFV